MIKNSNKAGFTLIIVLLLTFGLSGCLHDDDDAKVVEPLPDQDASGLFKGGTAQLDGGTLMLNDIIGFVHNDRIIMFSIDGHVLFDGQINSLLSDDYAATVDVYENGVKTQSDVSVTGTVLTESKITGTLTGTGKASGDFTLTFDPLYSRGASFARIEATGFNTWGNAPSYSVNDTQMLLNFNISGIYSGTNTQNPSCQYSNGVVTIPSDQFNIFLLNNDVIEGGSCAIIGTGYTGFGSVIDGVSVDDTLLYAVTNGTNSVFAVLTK